MLDLTVTQKTSMLEPEKQNSVFLKKELSHYLYWRLGYPVVVDEFQFMDIFGVRRTGYGVEFEIKVSKSDFDREIRLIKGEQPKQYSKDWTKWEKHAFYLKKRVDETKLSTYAIRMRDLGLSTNVTSYYVPNEFYFYVPDYLTQHALRELVGLPYGLVQVGKYSYNNGHYFGYSAYEVIKKADKLHTDKVDGGIFKELAHSLTIRSRLFL